MVRPADESVVVAIETLTVLHSDRDDNWKHSLDSQNLRYNIPPVQVRTIDAPADVVGNSKLLRFLGCNSYVNFCFTNNKVEPTPSSLTGHKSANPYRSFRVSGFS